MHAFYEKSTVNIMIDRLKVKGWTRHTNTNQKKPGVSKLIPGKTDSRTRKIIREKEGQ